MDVTCDTTWKQTGAEKDSLVQEGGNETGIAIFKNRLYLRKKSFFERFFAHKTGKDTKKYINDKVTATCKLEICYSFTENI